MEQNLNSLRFVPFSYIISILLIYPFLKSIAYHYNFPFYYLFFISIPSGLLVNTILVYIDRKYNFVDPLAGARPCKVLKSNFFYLYLLFSLQIENILRKKNNAFFFGFMFRVLLILLYIGLKNTISFKFVWLYTLYYYILVYIKVRSSLVNNEILGLNKTDYIKIQDFLNFYKIKKSNKEKFYNFIDFNKNYEFKNITPFFFGLQDPLALCK